ncbi:MAG: ACT domain-containing protein [Treponema sp.]|jgi:ACT domain-containing protein|nr:ACT domain-containing protein [Treponema sp.]
MNAVITVVGNDQVGIIATVSTYLAKHSINIVDITQTILSGNFVMMMKVDIGSSNISIEDLRRELTEQGHSMKVEINIMDERIFSAMNRI